PALAKQSGDNVVAGLGVNDRLLLFAQRGRIYQRHNGAEVNHLVDGVQCCGAMNCFAGFVVRDESVRLEHGHHSQLELCVQINLIDVVVKPLEFAGYRAVHVEAKLIVGGGKLTVEGVAVAQQRGIHGLFGDGRLDASLTHEHDVTAPVGALEVDCSDTATQGRYLLNGAVVWRGAVLVGVTQPRAEAGVIVCNNGGSVSVQRDKRKTTVLQCDPLCKLFLKQPGLLVHVGDNAKVLGAVQNVGHELRSSLQIAAIIFCSAGSLIKSQRQSDRS